MRLQIILSFYNSWIGTLLNRAYCFHFMNATEDNEVQLLTPMCYIWVGNFISLIAEVGEDVNVRERFQAMEDLTTSIVML